MLRKTTPTVTFFMILTALNVLPARAGEQITLPEITVRPPTVSDRNGGGMDSRVLERLNKQLKRKADEPGLIINAPPFDARSPDTAIGIVNIPGVQQQYGQNFGKSVIPYRPSAPVFSAPIGPRR
ncbi:hypothetical protein [Rhodoblastus sphagnicola]|nr:hypothetical protein [Rhodoblastus sphagnicola]